MARSDEQKGYRRSVGRARSLGQSPPPGLRSGELGGDLVGG